MGNKAYRNITRATRFRTPRHDIPLAERLAAQRAARAALLERIAKKEPRNG